MMNELKRSIWFWIYWEYHGDFLWDIRVLFSHMFNGNKMIHGISGAPFQTNLGFSSNRGPQIHPKSELEIPLTLPGSSVSRKTHVGPSWLWWLRIGKVHLANGGWVDLYFINSFVSFVEVLSFRFGMITPQAITGWIETTNDLILQRAPF